jgi:hypothetical protein
MDEKTLEERARWRKERVGQFYGKRLSDQALRRHRMMQISTGEPSHWDIRILAAPDSHGSRRQIYRNRVKAADGRRYANAMCTKYRIPFQNVIFSEDQQVALDKDGSSKPRSMQEVRNAQAEAQAAAAAAKAQQQAQAGERKKATTPDPVEDVVDKTQNKKQSKARNKSNVRAKAKGEEASQG